ncbi:metallophosphoesterase family protein [Aureivirga sp. CE67]|uniref:metallophosphoesterase family protein n=1 Tax=Aureivirga sp. CE67 TaxID=1788983 RepID=UPI0018C9DB7D|nr:metallophosphoesterase family protein [Aureivirga sp. CE67]
MKKTFVIGDIHGGLKALKEILEKAPIEKDDLLIFLGDYVDGWSESSKVIQFLIELEKKQSCIFIEGNHDLWCRKWLENGETPSTWLLHGGRETIESYKRNKNISREEHLSFLKNLVKFYVDKENRLFIHAGFTSTYGPERELSRDNHIWDRTLWELALATQKDLEEDHIFYPKRLKLFKEIFIGHTPTTRVSCTIPMQAMNVWNVDTGAAFKGKLSIMDIDSQEYWQSEALPILYPMEKGRNKD